MAEFNDDELFLSYAKKAIGHEPLNIKIQKLDKKAVIPSYAHKGDVGMDLTAISVEYDREKDIYIYHTGLAVESDEHYGIFLFPRSSNRKTDAYLCNHVGIVDSAIYRGEIMLCFKNRTSLEVREEIEKSRYLISRLSYEPFTVSNGDGIRFQWQDVARDAENAGNWIYDNPMDFAPYQVGDRVAQMVVLPYPQVNIIETENLSITERGSKGFGSTGN
jgi:dUTP pyrophosphatase